jgi:hypothetical protein
MCVGEEEGHGDTVVCGRDGGGAGGWRKGVTLAGLGWAGWQGGLRRLTVTVSGDDSFTTGR